MAAGLPESHAVVVAGSQQRSIPAPGYSVAGRCSGADPWLDSRGADTSRPPKLAFVESTFAHHRPHQLGPSKETSFKLCLPQISSQEPGGREVGDAEIRIAQIRAGKIGAYQSRAHEPRPPEPGSEPFR